MLDALFSVVNGENYIYSRFQNSVYTATPKVTTVNAPIVYGYDGGIDGNAANFFSRQRQLALENERVYILAPRLAGLVALICALVIMYMSWTRRKHLFHRLVFALSVHLLVINVFYIYGIAAVPESYAGDVGNFKGTTATCTLQGFIIYFCSVCTALYYCSFSVYSYICIMSNFDKEKYRWIEKYIHFGVYIYPVCASAYLLSIQAYNYCGFGNCALAPVPIDCGIGDPNDESYIPCERGPEKGFDTLKLFWIIPNVFYIVAPTIVMLTLFFKRRQLELQHRSDKPTTATERGASFRILAKDIVKEAAIYLFALYLKILPYFIFDIIMIAQDDHDVPSVEILRIYADINQCLFGFWVMLVYCYFTVDRKKFGKKRDKNKDDNNRVAISASSATKSTELVFSETEMPRAGEISNDDAPLGRTKSRPSHQKPMKQISFNIFDGTNAAGAFADFIYDGNSDDEREGDEENKYWNDVQNRI